MTDEQKKQTENKSTFRDRMNYSSMFPLPKKEEKRKDGDNEKEERDNAINKNTKRSK